jgi:hypothetical protein
MRRRKLLGALDGAALVPFLYPKFPSFGCASNCFAA